MQLIVSPCDEQYILRGDRAAAGVSREGLEVDGNVLYRSRG